METANNSKLINQVETELRSRLTQKGQRVLAAEAGWHESKVSRLNLRDMATVSGQFAGESRGSMASQLLLA